MDNILSFLGLILRSGRLEVGDEPAAIACREKDCRLLLAASDAAEATARRAGHLAETGQCLLLTLPYTKEELGAALGRSAVALAAVTDVGMAKALSEKLAQRDPERFGQTASALAVKARRQAQRREARNAPAPRRKRGK